MTPKETLSEEMEKTILEVQAMLPPGWCAGWEKDHATQFLSLLIENTITNERIKVGLSLEEILVTRKALISQKIAKKLYEFLARPRLQGSNDSS